MTIYSISKYLGKIFLKLSFHFMNWSKKNNYEPVSISNKIYPAKREWGERWNAISKMIEKYQAKSIMDVGCAEAWFLRKASEEYNCFSIGIEASHPTLAVSETARLYDQVNRLAIMQCLMKADEVSNLPKCDIVLCLSLVHHIIRINGIDEAYEFVKGLSKVTNKILIFEMGTSEEKVLSWSKKMPEMKNGQEEFLKEFLSKCGFKNINVIAKTAGIEGDADRLLVYAEPVK